MRRLKFLNSMSRTVWSVTDPSSSNHKRHPGLFKVQWVAPKWLCPPARPAWRRASQAAASTACRPSRSRRGSGKRNPNPRRLRPGWRMPVWIPWLLARSPSMLPSPRRSPPSPRSVDKNNTQTGKSQKVNMGKPPLMRFKTSLQTELDSDSLAIS